MSKFAMLIWDQCGQESLTFYLLPQEVHAQYAEVLKLCDGNYANMGNDKLSEEQQKTVDDALVRLSDFLATDAEYCNSKADACKFAKYESDSKAISGVLVERVYVSGFVP